MKKYLFLVGNRNGQFFYNIQNTDEVKVFSMYKDMSKVKRFLRKFFNTSVSINKHFYEDWKNLDDEYDCVICEDCTVDSAIIKFLRKKFSKAELIYWFRNSLGTIDYVAAKERNLCIARNYDRVLSFDKSDCEKYGFNYIENCYSIDKTIQNHSIDFDMIFLGTDKSRYDLLMSIIKRTEELNWNNFIRIYSYTRKKTKYITHSFMDYREYLEVLVRSRAVLDIVDESYQNGYSLRVFEALFYKKKLITNHQMIKKEPFYNSNNIFIFNANDFNSLGDLDKFLDKPYKDIPQKLLQPYNFENWIRRI